MGEPQGPSGAPASAPAAPAEPRGVAPVLLAGVAVVAVAVAGALAVVVASPDEAGGPADARTEAAPVAVAAVLSADGSRVTVAADAPDGLSDQLYVMAADGTGLRLLVDDASLYSTAPMAFGPDGRHLLYVGYPEGGQEGGDSLAVLRVDLDGGGPERLSELEGALPAFSPDGSRIAFSADGPGGEDLFLAGVDGSGRRALTDMAGEEFAPAFSPDGSVVAFEHSAGPDLSAVWLVRTDGTDARRLTPADTPASGPLFTPDGRRVVFTSGVDDSAPEYGAYSMDVSGTGTPERYDDARSTSDVRAGRRVYVEDGEVFISAQDGSGARRLTTWQAD